MGAVLRRSTGSLGRMNRFLAALLLTSACAAPVEYAAIKPSLVWPPTCPLQPKSVTRVEPSYPIRAMRDGQSGWVLAVYDILADGSTANARVIGSSPKGIFDDAVLAAIGRSKFEANSPRQQCPYHSQFNVR